MVFLFVNFGEEKRLRRFVMTRRNVTDEMYGQFQRRLDEVARRVDEGTIPFEETMDSLQKVIEGNSLLIEITIGDRTYEILGFLRGEETLVVGYTMVDRAKEMNAHLGQDDGEYILKHQDEIPASLRGKVVFVFTDWRHPDSPERVYCVYWHDGRWVRHWSWLDDDGWVGDVRFLRRK